MQFTVLGIPVPRATLRLFSFLLERAFSERVNSINERRRRHGLSTRGIILSFKPDTHDSILFLFIFSIYTGGERLQCREHGHSASLKKTHLSYAYQSCRRRQIDSFPFIIRLSDFLFIFYE